MQEFFADVAANIVSVIVISVAALVFGLIKKYWSRDSADWSATILYALWGSVGVYVIYFLFVALNQLEPAEPISPTQVIVEKPAPRPAKDVLLDWMLEAGLTPSETDPRMEEGRSFEYEVSVGTKVGDIGPPPILVYANNDDIGDLIMLETFISADDCAAASGRKRQDILGEIERAVVSTRTTVTFGRQRGNDGIKLTRYIKFDANRSATWFLLELDKTARVDRIAQNMRPQVCSEE